MMTRSFFAASLALLLHAPLVHAGPFVSDKVRVKTYKISGSSLPELKHQMSLKGPKGFWAYTTYNYRWDGRCNMRFSGEIIMPKLAKRNALDAGEMAEWDRMRTALRAHEELHINIGRGWAAAIKAAKCRDSELARINAQWSGKDKALDQATGHGRSQGAFLKE